MRAGGMWRNCCAVVLGALTMMIMMGLMGLILYNVGKLKKYSEKIAEGGALMIAIGALLDIIGVYKDVADITFSQLMTTSAHTVEMFRNSMPKFIQGLTKIVGFRLLFIIFTYLCFPQYLFTSGLLSGLGAKLAKLSNKLAHKNTTLRMEDQLEKIDDGDDKTRSGLQNSQNGLQTSVRLGDLPSRPRS